MAARGKTAPVQPSFGPQDPTDVAARRLGAAAIEFGSYFVVSQVLSLAFNAGNAFLGPQANQSIDDNDLAWLSGGLLIATLVPLAYLAAITVVMRAVTGASLGQRLLGLVTVDEHGQPLGGGTCVLRALLGVVDGFPYCCYLFLVGGISMFTTDGHRRVADRILKAYVVPKEYLGVPLGPPEQLGAVVGPCGRAVGPYGQAVGADAPTGGDPGARWDETRGCYVRWDGARWVGWDDATQQWRPLS